MKAFLIRFFTFLGGIYFFLDFVNFIVLTQRALNAGLPLCTLEGKSCRCTFISSPETHLAFVRNCKIRNIWELAW